MKKLYYILVLLLMACGTKSAENKQEPATDDALIRVSQAQFDEMKMEMTPLQDKLFQVVVKASGQVTVPPQSHAKISSLMGGFINATYLLVGDKVNKGQVLMNLESTEYVDMQQAYMATAGELAYLKYEYERQKTLSDEKIASQAKYLEAQSIYKKAKASYDGLHKKLLMLHIDPNKVLAGELTSSVAIRSPIDGVVTQVNTNVGLSVAPADVMMEIIDIRSMHLELSVFENDINQLHQGQEVRFYIPRASSKLNNNNLPSFEGKVSLIEKSVEKTNRIITVYCQLPDSVKQQLMVGMFVEGEVVVNTKQVTAIPFDALATEESNFFILVLDSKTADEYVFRKVLVQTGDRDGDWIEIQANENIPANTPILVKGVFDVM